MYINWYMYKRGCDGNTDPSESRRKCMRQESWKKKKWLFEAENAEKNSQMVLRNSKRKEWKREYLDSESPFLTLS